MLSCVSSSISALSPATDKSDSSISISDKRVSISLFSLGMSLKPESRLSIPTASSTSDVSETNSPASSSAIILRIDARISSMLGSEPSARPFGESGECSDIVVP